MSAVSVAIQEITRDDSLLLAFCEGWEWEGAWQVDTSGFTDKDGWSYATDFGLMTFPPRQVSIIATLGNN